MCWDLNIEPCKKSYYVDNHESPENVEYCNKFITRYFTYELRCHRWVSVSKTQRNEMVKKGQIDNGLGYEYRNMNGEIFFEFHVDDHELFHNMCSNLPFGGHLSVRFPPNKKPLMLIGQDECIFKQFVFTKSVWVLLDGTRQ